MQHKRAQLRVRLCATNSTTPLQPHTRLCSTDSTTSLQPPCLVANPHPSSCQVTTWPLPSHGKPPPPLTASQPLGPSHLMAYTPPLQTPVR